jgi:microtubule-associated protein-like 1/2
MDVHPSRELVGSGQRGGRDRKSQAHVRIWSTESLQTLYVFGMGELDTGVLSVAFSQLNGGSYILAVDAGRESILSVWQWQWGHLLGKVAVGRAVSAAKPITQGVFRTFRRCKKASPVPPSIRSMTTC